ncbi:MAG: HigA family addiction module antidote protein [Nitrospira sp.]|nr:HigA family addiction module antidote protein [Nitrospira sp.]
MSMENPPHPGLVVLEECIEPLGLNITDAATTLGVPRNTLSELVNDKRGIFLREQFILGTDKSVVKLVIA